VPDDPRRLGVADLTGRLAAALAGQVRAYDAAAERAEGALRQALEQLGRAQRAQAAELAPLAHALGVPTASPVSETPAGAHPGWGVVLGEAFQGERALQGMGRELAGLTEDPAVRALALRLVAGAGRDGQEVRKLYLRYT
jgi:hypothetical protein